MVDKFWEWNKKDINNVMIVFFVIELSLNINIKWFYVVWNMIVME